MKLSGTQITVIACVALVVMGLLVFAGKLPANTLTTPIIALVMLLVPSPVWQRAQAIERIEEPSQATSETDPTTVPATEPSNSDTKEAP